MDDKSSSLKIKLHLIFYADVKQRQDQQHLTVEEKKGGSSTWHLIYKSVREIGRDTYVRKIKPAKFCKRLDQYNQLFKQKCDKEGDETTLSQTIRPGPSSLRGYGALGAKRIVSIKRYSSKRDKESSECANKACQRTPRTRQAILPKNAQRRRRSGAYRKKKQWH